MIQNAVFHKLGLGKRNQIDPLYRDLCTEVNQISNILGGEA